MRQPQLQRDESAATLLEQIRIKPGDVSARTKLAQLYASGGFQAMAYLIDASAAAATQGRPITYEGEFNHVWACGADASSNVAERLTEDIHDGQWAEARAKAERAIESDPSSCSLRLALAHAVMMQTAESLASGNAADRELAVRTWVTLSHEGNVIPPGVPDISSAYVVVAQYFSMIGDPVTAMAAYRIARLHLDPSAPKFLSESIEESIRKLSSRKPN